MAAAEIEIDVALVRGLLTEQHPDLAGLPLRVVAQGWDNVMTRLGDDLAVRLPRRAIAAPLVEHEQEWLPRLAPHLPVRVPVPVRIGRPSTALGYPWSWSVVPWVPGLRGADVPRARRGDVAAALAGFLAAMHRPAPPDAPENPYRGGPLAGRDGPVRDRLAAGVTTEVDRCLAVWSQAVAAEPWHGPALWLHGDPHPGNLVLADDGATVTLAAVADLGDLTSGDPATDLAAAWTVFDAAGRETFRAELAGPYPGDDPVWVRARGWALTMATSMLTSGPEHAWLLPLGREALAEVLAEA
ncbi:aminoglycoside phosphotransferase (APT) family kinase protein [Isoptericola jiangsuensis]|uniref:Aminoglycoside phosphotransferase (APT) family kinase protein n=1 Tax=Isoptericola jiangsuensis TaxID=548579 RepID=A0A2A9EZ34_9MICO|nr:aminoglycoside phosphotransferase family protein [Isoptericola jiangsuensis]PFG43409.1 aminoglycoside phosphotransferase (APT) family kinase protein [Isoptericola jiangsuensis]